MNRRSLRSVGRLLLLLPALLSSAGCASLGAALRPLAPDVAARGEGDEQGLYLRLVSELIEEGKLHAALAYLDAIPEQRAGEPRVRFLRAEVLRRMGRFAEASALYAVFAEGSALYAGRGESGLAGQAWRGLGLIEAARGNLEGARECLGRARALRPADPRIRNDLGYALLLGGELEAAGAELATAIELGDTLRAPRNLVLLLLVKGESASAEALARRHLDAGSIGVMRARAEALRAQLHMGGGA